MLSDNTSGIECPDEIRQSPCLPEEIVTFVKNIDPAESQGIVIYYGIDTPDFGCIKITNHKYRELSEVRANCSNIILRYLQIRGNGDLTKKLIELYPNHAHEFYNCEEILCDISTSIYEKYLQRFIHRNADGTKNFVVFPQEQWFIAKELHELYVQDPEYYKISLQLIVNYIDRLSADRLYKLIELEKTRSVNRLENN